MFSSVGLERYLDRVEVISSNLITPTNKDGASERMPFFLFYAHRTIVEPTHSFVTVIRGGGVSFYTPTFYFLKWFIRKPMEESENPTDVIISK